MKYFQGNISCFIEYILYIYGKSLIHLICVSLIYAHIYFYIISIRDMFLTRQSHNMPLKPNC